MYIHKHQNTPRRSHNLAMNKFGDMTNEEFKARFNNYHPGMKKNVPTAEFDAKAQLPDSVDWRTKGVVTPVKNQEQCGSCWAFSTTGSVEGIHALKTGKLISLSEQELVDCSGSAGNQGCNGGIMQDAFTWIKGNGGICTESAYPYTATDGTCKKSQCTSAVDITGFVNVAVNSEAALQAGVALQPVSVAVDAGGMDWQFYSGGVLSDACGTQLDHGVLAVGYGSQNGTPYWLVKNSWGASWGESGYILLKRGSGSGNPGECGIAMDASYPTA
jgi:C1A family cysteine protease